MVAALLALAAALVTAFLAGLAYNGFLQPGNSGRAAAIALGGGAVTAVHVHAAVGLFRGWRVSRPVAVVLFAFWLVVGVLALFQGGKSSGGWMGIALALLAATGLVDLLAARPGAAAH